MSEDDDMKAYGYEGGIIAVLIPKEEQELKEPKRFKVIILNDDYTPMEFVIEVLEIFFKKNREQATYIMLTVHTKGKGICGIYTRDIAETKSTKVNQYAREHEHPLLCQVESA